MDLHTHPQSRSPLLRTCQRLAQSSAENHTDFSQFGRLSSHRQTSKFPGHGPVLPPLFAPPRHRHPSPLFHRERGLMVDLVRSEHRWQASRAPSGQRLPGGPPDRQSQHHRSQVQVRLTGWSQDLWLRDGHSDHLHPLGPCSRPRDYQSDEFASGF